MMKTMKYEFWVGFRDTQYFTKKILKKGFGHCYVIGRDQYNWVMIDPRNGALEVSILPYRIEDDVAKMVNEKEGHRFIKIEINREIKKWPNLNPFRMIHCTNIVKYILGIHLWALTPYKLYRKLLRLNEQQMKKRNILKIELIS
jgi:hypothetical protein